MKKQPDCKRKVNLPKMDQNQSPRNTITRMLPFKGEKRLLCASPKVATYDLQPEMSAFDVRDSILPEIEQKTANFNARIITLLSGTL